MHFLEAADWCNRNQPFEQQQRRRVFRWYDLSGIINVLTPSTHVRAQNVKMEISDTTFQECY